MAQQNIIIEILEDNIPEPDEVFDIILASPKNGLTVGSPGKRKLRYENNIAL